MKLAISINNPLIKVTYLEDTTTNLQNNKKKFLVVNLGKITIFNEQ